PEQHGLCQQAGIEQVPHLVIDLIEELTQLQRATDVPQNDQPDQKPDVANAGGDERLFGGDPRRQQMDAAPRAAVEPEADQQVAAQADQLPADEQEQQIVGQDDGQ